MPPMGRRDFYAEPLGHERVAKLVQEDAEEQRHDHEGGDDPAEHVSRLLKSEVSEEDQQQEKGPVDLNIYAESSADLERAAHTYKVYPTIGGLM